MADKLNPIPKSLEDRPVIPGTHGEAFAPANIALIKYWGKRCQRFNLPLTNSLSVSLGQKGTTTKVQWHEGPEDLVFINDDPIGADQVFHQRISQFLNWVRPNPDQHFRIDTHSNIPIAAGLASSASGFAALAKALKALYQWDCSDHDLSILARLGSGSACRSLWDGFVEWHKGSRADGLDSAAMPLNIDWPQLRIGLLVFTKSQKPISSRAAMQQTIETSKRFQQWPQRVAHDLARMHTALNEKNFDYLGQIAENNALEMHATMEDAQPSIRYSTAETVAGLKKVWQARADGIPVYATQDAGPNVKLLFEEKDQATLLALFPDMEVTG